MGFEWVFPGESGKFGVSGCWHLEIWKWRVWKLESFKYWKLENSMLRNFYFASVDSPLIGQVKFSLFFTDTGMKLKLSL